MAYKIYLSAAAHQTDNRTACAGNCSENTHCNAYMDVVERRLKELGFAVMRGSAALTGDKAMKTRVKEANKWKADLYYVAHTNAGGGRYSMTMCWPNADSRMKANAIHRYRQCIPTHKVVDNNSLYEIRQTAMTCLYDELFFHDNAEDCRWFHTGGMEKLAEETVQAFCTLFGVPYKAPNTVPVKPAATPETPVTAAPKAGDHVTLQKGRLYLTARGSAYVTRTGTFYLYDGVKVGNRYRVTNRPDRVGKTPVVSNVSGWVEL